MSLEYKLLIKGSNNPEQIVKEILTKKAWSFKEEKQNEQSLLIIPAENFGFLIFILPNFTWLIELENTEKVYDHSITFRVNKSFNPENNKRKILEIIKEILANDKLDLLFLFNGEMVLLVKDSQNGIRINDNDFWNNNLTEYIQEFKYKKQNFDIL